jgi:O-antigen/teichoic acid export membrane protein
MDKALTMGMASAAGSFKLFIVKIVSTIILAIGTIILGILISQSDYGSYTIAIVPASTFLLFQDWGISSALTKYCASCRATGEAGELRKIIVAGISFEAATGIVLTLLSILTAGFIATNIFHEPIALLIIIGSIAMLFQAILGITQSVFTGFERIGFSSYTMACQAATYSVFVLLLVYMGYGALGAIIGVLLSSAISTILGLGLLYFGIFRKLRHNSQNQFSLSKTLKKMLKYGTPLGVASIFGGLLTQYSAFLMGSFYAVALIGSYKVANNFAILLAFFTLPISTVLFPAFSKIDPKKELSLLKMVFSSSVRYASIFLVPATLAMVVLANSIISTIYGVKYAEAPAFLVLFALSNLLVMFGSLSMGNLLQAMGETKLLMKLTILTLSIGLPLTYLLATMFGLSGIIIASIVTGLPSTFIGLYLTWKRYGTTVDYKVSAKIFIASAVAALVTYLILNVFIAPDWLKLLIGLVIFLAIYLSAAPLVGAVNQADVNSLRAMFSSLGPISKIFEIPLAIMEIPLRIRARRTESRTT